MRTISRKSPTAKPRLSRRKTRHPARTNPSRRRWPRTTRNPSRLPARPNPTRLRSRIRPNSPTKPQKPDQKQPAEPDAQGQPGQMSPQEAKSLLDSLKKDEHALPSAPDARAESASNRRRINRERIGNSMKRIFLLCAATLSLALTNVRAAEVTATLEPRPRSPSAKRQSLP